MKIREALLWGEKMIGNLNASKESELILSFLLNKPKEFFYAHPEEKISPSKIKVFKKIVLQRKKRIPLFYLIQKSYFWEWEFIIKKGIFIPRFETEIILEEVIKAIPQKRGKCFLDLGTGSGILAISLAKLFGGAEIFATDISKKALTLAKENAKKHLLKCRIRFFQGDLLKPVKNIFAAKKFVLVANLPYLRLSEWEKTMPEIKNFEPKRALEGGKDGLKYFKKLFCQFHHYQIFPQKIFLEISPSLREGIKKLCQKFLKNYSFEIKKDLAGRERLLFLSKSNG